MRNEKNYFIGYAKCGVTSHQALLRFYVLNADEHIIETHVPINEPMIEIHDNSSMTPFSQIQGPKREKFRKLLKHLRVLEKIKSEECCEGNYV